MMNVTAGDGQNNADQEEHPAWPNHSEPLTMVRRDHPLLYQGKRDGNDVKRLWIVVVMRNFDQ